MRLKLLKRRDAADSAVLEARAKTYETATGVDGAMISGAVLFGLSVPTLLARLEDVKPLVLALVAMTWVGVFLSGLGLVVLYGLLLAAVRVWLALLKHIEGGR